MTVPRPALSQDQIRAQLRRVPEPCGLLMREPVDICEMGLVDEISVTDGEVRVELVLTDPSCVHFRGLRRYITDVLLELPGVDAVQVAISTTTLWTPDRQTGRAARHSPVNPPAAPTHHSLPAL
jgi:metal-sulfur cluster biosynthetic enzyme